MAPGQAAEAAAELKPAASPNSGAQPAVPLSGLQSSTQAPVAFAAEMEKVRLCYLGQSCPTTSERQVGVEQISFPR